MSQTHFVAIWPNIRYEPWRQTHFIFDHEQQIPREDLTCLSRKAKLQTVRPSRRIMSDKIQYPGQNDWINSSSRSLEEDPDWRSMLDVATCSV
jgi:hypothetical protein